MMFQRKEEGFFEREQRIQKLWSDQQIFSKVMKQKEKAPVFSYYDGPPFATGLPHYGHLLSSTIKDTILRFKTMKGFKVPRSFGWDCHGLPVENEIEKALELKGAAHIQSFGIEAFNEECRQIVLRYSEEWKKTIQQLGRWVDFDNIYRTMDLSYMESVWWVFSQLWSKELIYKGFKVMPFSAQMGTPLSNFEANLNYKEVDDPSLVVEFSLTKSDAVLLIWTTTPWTLVSNMACVVNPQIKYVQIKSHKRNKRYILAQSRVDAYFEEDDIEIEKEYHGEELAGLTYHPPFPYFKKTENAFVVLADEFVGDDEGTGIVHAAPAFGESDFFVCEKARIPLVCPVDTNGKFTEEIPEYKGVFVKDADKDIVRRLKNQGLVFNIGTVRHRYPFCWRSDTPLLYKTVSTWFVHVEKIKTQLIDANKKIHWVPEHIKKGRFGNWLHNVKDWAISRNRFWGTPIPIWQAEDGDVIVISSLKELQKRTGKKVKDLHRHFIDDLTIEENGKVYKRIPEVFDCWFESGSMPYAQFHYPFENENKTKERFPADFITEGLDQTRGWFYTLNVLSVALFNESAFKNVIVNGIILADDGQKMSKRLKNYPDPSLVMERYGADALRLFLLQSPATYGDDLCFTEEGVALSLRQFLLPLWNAYSFFASYANIINYTPPKNINQPMSTLNKWILSSLQNVTRRVDGAFGCYHLPEAVQPLLNFIDDLTNWFIRRSRALFWSSDPTPERQEAFDTLYTVLKQFMTIMAPFTPFLAESIYQNLRTKEDPLSVHMCSYPIYDATARDPQLEQEIELVQKVVKMGHSLRGEKKIKVRQPLSKLSVATKQLALINYSDLILDELNIKNLELIEDEETLVKITIKPFFPLLGKRFGKQMPTVQKALSNLTEEQKKAAINNLPIQIDVDGHLEQITADEFEIVRTVKEGTVALNDGEVTVLVDLELTPDLVQEGMVRELVNRVNGLRKEKQFELSDRIELYIDCDTVFKEAVHSFEGYLKRETLTEKLIFSANKGKELKIDEHLLTVDCIKKST